MKRGWLALFICGAIGCGARAGESSGGSSQGSMGTETTGTAGSTGQVAPTGGSTGGSTSGGEAGDTAGLDGSGFIVKPDGLVGEIKCDVFAQDCPVGEKCTGWVEGRGDEWNATKCVEVKGHRLPGEVCTAEDGGESGIDDCALGGICWFVDDMGMGKCVALCAGTPDAPFCEQGEACSITSSSALALCLPDCDPLVQDCLEGELCIIYDSGSLCVLDASDQPGAANDPCEFVNACDAGLACLPSAEVSSACMQDVMGCCTPYCELIEGEDGECPDPDQKCVQWFDPEMGVPEGFEDVGVCRVPA